MTAESETEDHHRKRGVYLLPNLLTTVGLSAGFYAIVAAMNGDYEKAAVAIFVAMIIDGIDGRVARLTNTQSDFGAEYDSLSDMVCFGLAPALVVYEWALHHMVLHGWAKLGWIVAFVYTAATALRLARFNTQIGSEDKRYFKGLPSPSAAGLVAGLVWLASDLHFAGRDMVWVALFVTLAAGLLMVSNVLFHSFKQIGFRNRVSFFKLLLAVLALVLVYLDPPTVLFTLFLVYACSGPALALWRWRRRRSGETGDDAPPGGPAA